MEIEIAKSSVGVQTAFTPSGPYRSREEEKAEVSEGKRYNRVS